MNALVEQTAFGVTTSSRTVAEVFEKEHKHVLAKIDEMLNLRPDLRGPKFRLSSESVPMPRGGGTKELRCYEMNRDGFTLVAMGFTGEKALDWKLAYLEAFNLMEQELRARADAQPAAASVESRTNVVLELADTRYALAIAREMRLIYGTAATRRMWPRLGLPVPPAAGGGAGADPLVATWSPPESVEMWVEECGERDPQAKVAAAELYRCYTGWCAERQMIAETQRSFGDTLARMGFHRFKARTGNIWRKGLRLVDAIAA